MMITFGIFWDYMRLIIDESLSQLDGIVIIPPFFCHTAELVEEFYIESSC